MDLEHVSLPDSWVLSVESDSKHVSFVIDGVVERDHPRFYWPPKPGEQHSYLRFRWTLYGEVEWRDGPHLDKPAVDATGERDFGHIDSWLVNGGSHHLHGEWGDVVIRQAEQEIEYLDL